MSASPVPAVRRQIGLDWSARLGLLAVLLFFIASGVLSYWNTRMLSVNQEKVAHTHEVLYGLGQILSAVQDAETGQRGYVITGRDSYLDPYHAGRATITDEMAALHRLTRDNPSQQSRLTALQGHIDAKLGEMAETIELRRMQGFEAAHDVVLSDRGKREMDALRGIMDAMSNEERALRSARIDEMEETYKATVASGIVTALLGILLSLAITYLLRRAALTRQHQDWIRGGQVGLAQAMVGEQKVEELGDHVLKFLAEYFHAQAGVFYAKDGPSYRRTASYGLPAAAQVPERFEPGDGLLGQAVKDARNFILHDIPEGYIHVGSALGERTPRYLVIATGCADGVVKAVIELGFVQPVGSEVLELMERVGDAIGIAVKSANYRANLYNLLEETQRQAEELQAQSEELRVSNEELEEQSRALKESQVRLEQQQTELEQTNSQLEEQTQLLETQRDDLAQATSTVQLKMRELEQASQYKSDFLANMSHELRTPLNSSLILAKLLADNPAGNLNDEQVKYAQTIQSSGNDLLALINDILDLSKIEAGHMEIRPEPVTLSRLMNDLGRVFQPMAQQKGLTFHTQVEERCPATMETDRQRLEQVLKNLLSNAIKFTEDGKVELTVRCLDGERVAFTVSDTGIGISDEQQQAVFEAFRQADSTISRKYGGTGLGLSISRELTRLLGGTIELSSEAGKGSVFTVILPQVFDERAVSPAPVPAPRAPIAHLPSAPENAAPVRRRSRVEDDREKLTANGRTILVIEDDETFARILYDLAHEQDFQCLIAATAEEALVMTKQYLPSAVVLDVGLPDHSGLSVLDRLKKDPRTRHIPVHVVSAGDYAQTALSLGAVGYMLKPVKREELVEALEQFETRLKHGIRRVLIVEDDEVQRDSVGKLLGSLNVETVGVGTAAECLDRLKESTFDCMVLDLSLPDTSGYSLLETLSREDSYAFPPVIVYTGRDLSDAEEQKLRRWSKSIIIKGAKSPERLLDEVTLFLHQVVAELPPEQQRMIEAARNRDALLEGRRILIVEDDVRNVYALTSIFEPHGVKLEIARNGREALDILEKTMPDATKKIDLVLMDVMMPEMDGLTATRHIRQKPEWKKLPVIMLTAKAMKDDQERCLEAGASDYMAKPLDVEKLLSLVRVWIPR